MNANLIPLGPPSWNRHPNDQQRSHSPHQDQQLLEAAGWRFFAEDCKPANIRLEPSVTLKSSDLDALGENLEKTGRGFIDVLLLDARGFPLIVLETKSEDKNPLVGKEQARKYARSQNCRFVILSNGDLHYFWDLERGDPYLIKRYPSPDSERLVQYGPQVDNVVHSATRNITFQTITKTIWLPSDDWWAM